MVLRKPYAFLIKHFRLIHIIITVLFGYIAFKSRNIYVYLKSVIANSANRYNVLEYIDYKIYIYIFIALLLCFVVHWLLKYKDKPRKIYIFTIVGYIVVGIFMFVLYSYMSGFINSVAEQKTIRLYRDILTIALLFQYYITIFMAIRGLGFDIKKFDFRRDVQELNLGEEDSEEVEVNVGMDTTNIMRGIRKQRREFGYFLKEYKMYVMIITLFLVLFISYRGYNYFSEKYKVYQENQLVGNVYKVTIRDSYYNISEDNNYVIVSFDIYKNGVREQFNVNNMELVIGKKKYTPNKNVCYKFNKLGNCYKKQYINGDINNYVLSYEVSELNIQDAYIIYNESYDNYYKIKLVMKEY